MLLSVKSKKGVVSVSLSLTRSCLGTPDVLCTGSGGRKAGRGGKERVALENFLGTASRYKNVWLRRKVKISIGKGKSSRGARVVSEQIPEGIQGRSALM